MTFLTPIERGLVAAVDALKRTFGVRTHHVEQAFVAIILVTVAVVTGKGWVEWIGALAVFFTFCHANVSDRLAEYEAKRVAERGKAEVWCYHWSTRYLVLKEICWFVYFVVLGAWSALVGVFIFLLYPWWRSVWRKYRPLGRERDAEHSGAR